MRNHPDALMLFAAGFGTRMGALTAELPKPMIEVLGKPLIDHAREIIAPLGLRKVIANLHYKPEVLEAYLEDTEVSTIIEGPEILETGGGLRAAVPQLGEGPVFTLNSDAVWNGPNPLKALRAAWRPDEMDALLLCVPPGQTHGHKGQGDFVISPNGIAARGSGLIYSGAQIIKTDLLGSIPDRAFSLNKVWDIFLQNGRLHALSYGGQWCDVGSPEGIKEAEEMLSHAV